MNRWRWMGWPGILLAWVLLWIPSAGAESSKVVHIAVFMSQELDTYRSAVQGFAQRLQESGAAHGKTFQLDVFDGNGREDGFDSALSTIEKNPPDLIFAIGALAGVVLHKHVQQIPVVFTGLLDPIEKGLVVSLEHPGTNLTGTVAEPPMRTWMNLLRSVLPGARRIGLLYDPMYNRERVELASQEAERLGLEIIPEPVASPKEVPEALRNLIDRIDILWLMPDPTVISVRSQEYLFVRCLWSRKGVVGFSQSTVRSGGLVGWGPDYAQLGRQSADQAVRILEGASVRDVAVETANRMELWVNVKVARKLGVAFSSEVLARARQVFD